ncbi:hypothetical protein [Nocardia jejuensis]|uniref:hypothetical protein n=1 Tax=Nocardia jejuensis TaxID=328049 RepID=UPI000AAA342C|nr:hypothetical protein [Nocardia jejuensis]
MLPADADSVGPPTGSVGGTTAESAPVPIRPLQFHELLDMPFALIQARIKILGGLLGSAVLIASAVAVGATAAVELATGGSRQGTFWGAVVITLLCAWGLRFFVRGVTVPIGLSVVHRRSISWQGALHQLASEAGPLLGYQVMYTLIGIGVLTLGAAPVFLGLPFAVVWLGWLRAKRGMTVPVVFDESATYRLATARSKLLASGTEWQLVGLWMYLRILMIVLLVPLYALPSFVSDITGTRRWTVTILIIAAALLVVAFAEMVESATQVVTYVDRRCRREAWDITVPAEVRR